MLGSAQWYESSNDCVPNLSHYKNDCWVCSGHVYSVIFWSRGRAFTLNPVFKEDEDEPIRWEIDSTLGDESQPDYDPGLGFTRGNVPYEQLEDKVPILAGSFTGWRYRKMVPLHEFTRARDKDFIDPEERCIIENKVKRRYIRKINSTMEKKSDATKPSAFGLNKDVSGDNNENEESSDGDNYNKRELAHIAVKEVTEEQRYRVKWQTLFKQFMRYKKPFVINSQVYENINDK